MTDAEAAEVGRAVMTARDVETTLYSMAEAAGRDLKDRPQARKVRTWLLDQSQRGKLPTGPGATIQEVVAWLQDVETMIDARNDLMHARVALTFDGEAWVPFREHIFSKTARFEQPDEVAQLRANAEELLRRGVVLDATLWPERPSHLHPVPPTRPPEQPQ